MQIDPTPAKYATIANALRSRIDNGVYAPGSMLPSEAQLVREFHASRSTVVRALEYLRQLGYIEGVQGKGRTVLGPPPQRSCTPPARVLDALHAREVRHGLLIGAGQAPASPGVAAALAIPVGEPVIARQRVMTSEDSDWPALSTAYIPVVAADGTGFGAKELMHEGALDHLERRRRLVAGDVVERLTPRLASAQERMLLTLDRHAIVLHSLLTVRSSSRQPLLLIDVVMHVPSPGIEDTFSLH
ncbi:transcriptional regulator [Paractinoplanes deccanensis]|uniref:Transcriptional regulator n=1 Tax=Paractinoplanes deccanensis TaxID=113561 RepID=A0ABQ3YFS9_9ACTN|nr:GntR family transcriptional regulator [Actinoplanes deccanensis]GID78760.1 transcriptional regulator [Actinoplanes deccanensis]